MSQFELGWVGEYIPQNVAENDFLNQKLENDNFGIYYAVQFEGDADTYLLQAKKAPVKGETEYGMIEMSKSGKSKRFKRVKREDGSSPSVGKSSVADYEPSTNARWAIGMAYRAYVQITGSVDDSRGEFPFDAVELHAVKLMQMFNEVKNSGSEGNVTISTTKEARSPEPAAATLRDNWDKATGTESEELDD